jgi:hypothetical protein
MRGSWSPTQVNTRGKHDSKWPKDHNVKAKNSGDLNSRCWSLRDKEPYLNCGEDDVKGPHAEESKSTIDREASGSETGPNRAWAGRPRPAGPGRPVWPVSSPVLAPLWHRCLSINCLRLRQSPHPSIHRNSAKPRRERRWPPRVLEVV